MDRISDYQDSRINVTKALDYKLSDSMANNPSIRAFTSTQESLNVGLENKISPNDILITKELSKERFIDKVLSTGEGYFIIDGGRGARMAKVTGLTNDHSMAICQDPNSEDINSEYLMNISSMSSISRIQDIISKEK